MRDPETHHPEAALTVSLALRDALGLDLDDATLSVTTDRVMARLLARGYTVTRPAQLSTSRVEEMLPTARQAWDSTNGDVDDRLRAVVTELVPAIAEPVEARRAGGPPLLRAAGLRVARGRACAILAGGPGRWASAGCLDKPACGRVRRPGFLPPVIVQKSGQMQVWCVTLEGSRHPAPQGGPS